MHSAIYFRTYIIEGILKNNAHYFIAFLNFLFYGVNRFVHWPAQFYVLQVSYGCPNVLTEIRTRTTNNVSYLYASHISELWHMVKIFLLHVCIFWNAFEYTFYFTNDNLSCNRLSAIVDFLDKEDIQRLVLPPRSLDVNLI